MRAQDFSARSPREVLNQPVPLVDYNLWTYDTPAREALEREGGGWGAPDITAFGELLGTRENLELGDLANAFPPELKNWDRFGNRIGQVEFHPSYHALMRLSMEQGLHSLPWREPRGGSHVVRAALSQIKHQVEQGTSCPLTMTFAVVPSLQLQPNLAERWVPKATAMAYDPRFLPMDQKESVTFGMAMTERQGGSDVRANTTRATPVAGGGPGEEYVLNGHKWFCSAPMCDAFLVLAYTDVGLTCFLMPRWLPDGTVNVGFQINRLKNKLGNKSNASSEVEFHDAHAWMVGEEGRGVATIIEMVRHTRLDCTLGSTSCIRRAVAEATHHAAHRYAFGKLLIDQPLMKNVLADLCLESEATTALAFRLARSYDDARDDDGAVKFSRLATAIGKYWITKRETDVVREAMECHGGNGYVEEGVMGRLFRESPLNSIWEGSGNVQCLDVLRAVRRDPETLEAVFAELEEARGGDDRYDAFLDDLVDSVKGFRDLEVRARRVVERFAVALQASILVRHAPSEVADAFCASRLAGDYGRVFGTLPANTDFDTIIGRSRPHLN